MDFKVEVTQLTEDTIVNEFGSVPTQNKTRISLAKWIASEHSPIRALQFKIKLIGIPAYVAYHFKTHAAGVAVQVTESNRADYEDMYGKVVTTDRLAPVTHTMIVNAQTLIDMAYDRLCTTADVNTVKVMEAIKDSVHEVNPVVARFMVVKCVFRGGLCPETFAKCYYNHTPKFRKEFNDYAANFKYDPKMQELMERNFGEESFVKNYTIRKR
jgi:hypothetical protein